MEDQIINYETAVMAHNKNFDGKCEYTYNQDKALEHSINYKNDAYFTLEDIKIAAENDFCCYLAPIQSLLQKWLREVHDIFVTVIPDKLDGKLSFNVIIDENIKNYPYALYRSIGRTYNSIINTNTYEQALEKGLQEALKLIKDEQKKTSKI